MNCLENDHHEQLDFEDENALTHSVEKCHSVDNDSGDCNYSSTNEDSSSSTSSVCDEGELNSSDESESSHNDRTSEEGEIQSEIDELDGSVDMEPRKEETPWERGLRLARERLERTKALKVEDKDLVEKRMNLSVSVPLDEEKPTNKIEEDIFWSYYYQASIIGRTELTSHRYLPDDILPPDEMETSEWRRKVTGHRRGRNRQRRRSDACRYSSKSVSSRSISSESSSVSSDASSNISSLASVAASWKAVCARAMRDYIASPRRGRRYGSRHSSVSNSQSSGSRSTPRRSYSHQNRFGYSTTTTTIGNGDRRGTYWKAGKYSAQNNRSHSDHSSRSQSKSFGDDRRFNIKHWAAGDTKSRHDGSYNWRKYPGNTFNRRRTDAPLSNERPVKRPWVAAPNPGPKDHTINLDKDNKHHPNDRHGSSSRSHSPSLKGGGTDEKHFITSWSRSPSSNDDGQGERETLRRERLPDVIPGGAGGGNQIGRAHRTATPSKRKKSRSPFGDDKKSGGVSWKMNHSAAAAAAHTASEEGPITVGGPMRHFGSNRSNHQDIGSVSHMHQPQTESYLRPHLDSTMMDPNMTHSRIGGGELPSNRPGVRLTLAPRIKANVGINYFPVSSGIRGSTNRSFQPSPPPQPKPTRPALVPSFIPTGSVAELNHPPDFISSANIHMTQTQVVRQQAEVAAAALEARERRRVAAEAAYRHRHPRRKKRPGLENIPVRGRPTYRRQSFSNSSAGSRSSGSSTTSRSASGVHSTSDRGHVPKAESPNVYRVQSKTDDIHRMLPPKRNRYDQPEYKQSREFGRDSYDNYRRLANNGPEGRELDFNRHGRHPEPNQRVHPAGNIPRNRGPDSYGPNPFFNKSVQSFKRPYHAGPVDFQNHSRNPRSGINRDVVHNEELHYPNMAMRRGHIQDKERLVRPRTPHADNMNDDNRKFNRRSPHGEFEVMSRSECVERVSHRRVNYNIPEQVPTESGNDFEMRRARSRHRSRGPGGAPIDRSEPFESDAGSFAAEQRLRKLRERLNLVDDAIAEIKAGANTGPTMMNYNGPH